MWFSILCWYDCLQWALFLFSVLKWPWEQLRRLQKWILILAYFLFILLFKSSPFELKKTVPRNVPAALVELACASERQKDSEDQINKPRTICFRAACLPRAVSCGQMWTELKCIVDKFQWWICVQGLNPECCKFSFTLAVITLWSTFGPNRLGHESWSCEPHLTCGVDHVHSCGVGLWHLYSCSTCSQLWEEGRWHTFLLLLFMLFIHSKSAIYLLCLNFIQVFTDFLILDNHRNWLLLILLSSAHTCPYSSPVIFYDRTLRFQSWRIFLFELFVYYCRIGEQAGSESRAGKSP